MKSSHLFPHLISPDVCYAHPLTSVTFAFADFKLLLHVPSLHPHAVAEPRLHWIFSGHDSPVNHFCWLNCVRPQTGESATQLASSPSCTLLAISSTTDTSSYLYALSGYFLLCILLYYYGFISIEELKGSYLGVLNFPRIKEDQSLILDLCKTLWRWTISMSVVPTVISGGFTSLKVC